jgi:hypothetical protein
LKKSLDSTFEYRNKSDARLATWFLDKIEPPVMKATLKLSRSASLYLNAASFRVVGSIICPEHLIDEYMFYQRPY